MLNNLRVSSDIDETRMHQSLVTGKASIVTDLLGEIVKSGYRNIHPAWAIQLYLSRN